MAAISPLPLTVVLDGRQSVPEAAPSGPMAAFEDALASMLGSTAASANDCGPSHKTAAEPTLGLPLGARLTLDPPLNGVPSGPEASDETPAAEPISAESLVDKGARDGVGEDANDDEPLEDEALLMNPQGCFVTLPWLPAPEREALPATGSAPLPGVARAGVEVAAPSPRGAATEPHVERAQTNGPARRSTLPFPPPADATLQAARDLATAPPADSAQDENRARSQEKPALARPATTASHAGSRPIEPGFVVAPSFLEGGRIEWTIDAPIAAANDTHRSMAYAVAAAENEQRTQRSDGARPTTRRERATAAAPAGDVRESRDAERPRAVEASSEIARSLETIAGAASPEVPTQHAQAPRHDAGFERRMSASVAALPDHRADASVDLRSSEASRARRQDDAEVTVSQMTLSHRVEARTVIEDLGAITVRAETRHGHVEVSMAADRSETAAFLDQNRADLTRDLKNSAPSVSDVSMRTGDSGSGSRREQHAQRQPSPDWAAGTPSSMAAAITDTRAVSANGRRVRIVL